MAFFRGEEGSVKFKNGAGTTAAVTATRNWSLSITKDTLDTTAQGDTSRSFVGSLISGTGSLEMLYTGTAAETKELLDDALTTADAADAQFELYLSGTDKKITFTGLVTSVDFGASAGDVETATVNFQTSGAITQAV